MHGVDGEVVHAGFLRRWAALFLDQLLLTGAYYLLLVVVIVAIGAASGFRTDGDQAATWIWAGYVVASVLYLIVAGAYYAVMESSASQATLGKMALGIKVTDEHGNRLALPQALGRWFAAALSYLTLYIGFFAAGFTERKQALHDLIAKTLVVDKWAYTDTPERQQRGLNGCLIAFLVGMGLLLAIGVLGILAAIALPAYQDYTVRAHVANAYYAAEPVRRAVEAAGRCADVAAPESYRSPSVDRIEVEDQVDSCLIRVYLAERPGLYPDAHLRLRKGPSEADWTCDSDLQDRQLTAACR